MLCFWVTSVLVQWDHFLERRKYYFWMNFTFSLFFFKLSTHFGIHSFLRGKISIPVWCISSMDSYFSFDIQNCSYWAISTCLWITPSMAYQSSRRLIQEYLSVVWEQLIQPGRKRKIQRSLDSLTLVYCLMGSSVYTGFFWHVCCLSYALEHFKYFYIPFIFWKIIGPKISKLTFLSSFWKSAHFINNII